MKHTLDFDIYTRGEETTLIIVDASDYFERPSNAIVEIKFPDLDTIYSAYINPNTVNVLTTKKLAYNSDSKIFPDGLYQIRYSISPNKEVFICKNYLKLDNVKTEIAKILQNDSLEVEKINYLYDVDKYIQVAESIANTNPERAIEYFREILKKLKKLDCNVRMQ